MNKKILWFLIVTALTMTASQASADSLSSPETVRIYIDVTRSAGKINRDVAGIMTDPPRPKWLQDHLFSIGKAGDREAVSKHAGGANHFWLAELNPSFTNLGWGGDTWILFNTWPAEGEYNFEELDAWIQSHKDRGMEEISLVLSAVPEWLWSREDAAEPSGVALNFFPYLKNGHVLPPSDYNKYGEMIYQTVKHLNVEKGFGVKFSVWNEPNVKFWMGTQEELHKIAEVTTRAIKRADPNSMSGGPATAGFAPDWIEAFVQYYAENDLPLDFVSWHYYYWYAKQAGRVKSFSQQIETVNDIIKKYPSVGDPKYYITEWAYDWKVSDLLGPTFNGAFVAQSLFEMLEGGVAGATYCGNLGWLDAPDPAAQAFKFFNLLEDFRIRAEVDGKDSGVGILATGTYGRIALMVWNYPDDEGASGVESRSVSINLNNLGAGAYRVKRQLVDPDHHTSMDPHVAEEFTIDSGGEMKLNFDLKTFGITFVELRPKKG